MAEVIAQLAVASFFFCRGWLFAAVGVLHQPERTRLLQLQGFFQKTPGGQAIYVVLIAVGKNPVCT